MNNRGFGFEGKIVIGHQIEFVIIVNSKQSEQRTEVVRK